MKLNKWNVITALLSGAIAIVTLAQSVAESKRQDAAIKEEVRKALLELEK